MRGFSFSGLRARLLLLVLLAVIPALGLILYTAAEMGRTAAVEVQENALRLAQLASKDHDDFIEGARQLLMALAQLPEVRKRDSKACNTLFANLLKQYPLYATLGAVDVNGDPFCSAIPIKRPFSAADRAWFQRAVKNRGFAIGDYTIGRVSGKASLHFGYPVLDPKGAVQAVVLVGLDLEWLNKHAARLQLPAGTTLTVIDRKGTILVRFPEPEKWVGKSIPETPVLQTILREGEGTAELPSMDGIPRLYGFSPLGQAGDAYVSIGVPRDVAFTMANRLLARNLAGLGIVGVLALVAAWFGADLFVLRQVNALTRATKRLSEGDLSARAGLPYGNGEVGHLACAFDEMADALQMGAAARRAAETRFANILDIAADAVIAVNESQRIVLFNKRAEQIFGYSAGEVLGQPLDLLLPSRFVEAHRQHIHAFAAAPETVRRMDERREVFGRRRAGTEFPAEASVSKVTQDGQTIFTVILRDITERKLAEQRIKALVDMNTAITSTLDLRSILSLLMEKLDLFLLYATATTVRLFDEESGLLEPLASRNIDEREWRAEPWRGGRGIQRLVFGSKAAQTIRNVETDPRIRDLDFYRKHKLVSYLGVPLIVKDKVLGVLSLYTKEEHRFSDEEVEFLSTLAGQAAIAIHNSQLYERSKGQAVELERANEDLKRREEIQTLLKELSQDITRLDVDSLLKKLTEKVCKFFKVDVADVRVVEKGVWKVTGVSGVQADRIWPGGAGIARGRSTWIIENRQPLVIRDITEASEFPSGQTIQRVGIRGYLAAPIFSQAGEVIGILRALSYQPREFPQEEVDLLQQMANGAGIALENARLLEHIKNQAVELEKANKMQADFTAMIAHDLRSPLTAVVSSAAMLQDGFFGAVNEEQKKWLGKIEANVRNLVDLVNDFLDLSKLESGGLALVKEDVDLGQMIRNSLENYFIVAREKKISLRSHIAEAIPRLAADPRRLEQVFGNLISNALKFTPEGGEIEVGADRESGLGVKVWVRDNGVGIAPQEMAQIFEKYRQTASGKESKYKGTGLGLVICKMIVEAHGGRIWVESEEGKGTTVAFTMPYQE